MVVLYAFLCVIRHKMRWFWYEFDLFQRRLVVAGVALFKDLFAGSSLLLEFGSFPVVAHVSRYGIVRFMKIRLQYGLLKFDPDWVF